MALLAVPKAIVNGSLRLARVPFEIATEAIEALQGSASPAARERELADRLREQAAEREGQAERRLRERKAEAERSAHARRQRTAKSSKKAKRANAKREQAAKLEEIDAKEESIKAREAAAATEQETERLRKAAADAKRARKDGADPS